MTYSCTHRPSGRLLLARGASSYLATLCLMQNVKSQKGFTLDTKKELLHAVEEAAQSTPWEVAYMTWTESWVLRRKPL